MSAPLPGISLTPSRICLGTVVFGSYIGRDESFRVMDAFVEAGGNFFDTAHIYSAWIEGHWGTSERTLGEWVRARGSREDIIVATKGGHSPIEDTEKIGRLSRADLEHDLAESLDRLQLDYVDLYYIHFDEPSRPVGEIVESLAALQSSGRIRAYGLSNCTTDRIQAANDYAAKNDLPPCVASQPWFSLGAVANGPKAQSPTREDDDHLRAWHFKSGLPMVPYSSQANGYFGSANVAWAKGGFQGEPKLASSFDSPANRRRLLRTIDLAEKKDCTPNQIALAYLLNQPFPIYPVIGTGNPDHAREALGSVGISLTDEERASLFR